MAVYKEIIDDQLFVYMNGSLIYKRWLKTGQSLVFDVMPYDKHTLKSITMFDSVDEYLKAYLPRVTRLGDGSGLYEVSSPAHGKITTCGKNLIPYLKDKLLLYGLHLNIDYMNEERGDRGNIESRSCRTGANDRS